LLTGLALMALVLSLSPGASEAAASTAPPAAASLTTEAAPRVTDVTGQTARSAERVDEDIAADRAPAADRVAVLPGLPPQRVVSAGSAQTRTPGGAAYGFAFGQRAPPRR
jgi:hypothetical protein